MIKTLVTGCLISNRHTRIKQYLITSDCTLRAQKGGELNMSCSPRCCRRAPSPRASRSAHLLKATRPSTRRSLSSSKTITTRSCSASHMQPNRGAFSFKGFVAWPSWCLPRDRQCSLVNWIPAMRMRYAHLIADTAAFAGWRSLQRSRWAPDPFGSNWRAAAFRSFAFYFPSRASRGSIEESEYNL